MGEIFGARASLMNVAHVIVSTLNPEFLLHHDPVGSIVSSLDASQVTSALNGTFVHTGVIDEKLVPFREKLQSLLVGWSPRSLETHDVIEFIETHVRSKLAGLSFFEGKFFFFLPKELFCRSYSMFSCVDQRSRTEFPRKAHQRFVGNMLNDLRCI